MPEGQCQSVPASANEWWNGQHGLKMFEQPREDTLRHEPHRAA
jgi:hypothetical protein